MSERFAACALCGRPAAGFAFIENHRLCHGGAPPTCYERASALSPGELDLWEMDGDE